MPASAESRVSWMAAGRQAAASLGRACVALLLLECIAEDLQELHVLGSRGQALTLPRCGGS
jgi:hypothetical protein